MVYGTLHVLGTSSQPVTFTSTSSNKGDWYGIRVLSGGSADIQYANIEYGYCGIYLGSGSSAAEMKNSHISHNEVYGIRCQTNDAVIDTNTIEYNERYGIYAYNCLPSIKKNFIANHPSSPPSYGIYCNLVTQTSSRIEWNTLNGSDKEVGIYLLHSRPTVTDNKVKNDSVGIVCFGSESPLSYNELAYNIIGLECYDWAEPVVRESDIWHNTAHGVWVTTGANPDLGDTSISEGNNNICSNGGYNLYNGTYKDPPYPAVCIKVEKNWWGQNPPDTTKIYGCVDHDPWALSQIIHRHIGPPLPPPKVSGEETHPKQFSLSQNYPNPFNPITVIKYALPENRYVSLQVYNLPGQVVTTLVDGQKAAGYHQASWEGKNSSGQDVASGVYFYRIKAGSFVKVKKLVLLR